MKELCIQYDSLSLPEGSNMQQGLAYTPFKLNKLKFLDLLLVNSS